jgi:hypothetical protein
MGRGDGFSFRRWSREMTFAMFFCIVVLLFLNIRRDVVISNSIHLNLQHRHRFDEEKVRTGMNYAVCSKVVAMQEDIAVEEASAEKFSSVYEELVGKGDIGCGFQRVYGGLLGFLNIGKP